MKRIILSSVVLHNPIWVEGLSEPLLAIADVLEQQNRVIYADACRQAAEICQAFANTGLRKTHRIMGLDEL